MDFEQRHVPLKTEADGRIFPVSDQSQTIIDAIWQQMMANQVQVYYHKSITSIVKNQQRTWTLNFADGATYDADRVLIAVGGFSKINQYGWIEAAGHTVTTPVPSLFTFNMPGNSVTALMGVSVPNARVKIAGTKISGQGALLITHWGMSGPAILKTSAVAARELAEKNYDFHLIVNWLNDESDDGIKAAISGLRGTHGKQLVHHRCPFDLPRRLWEYLLSQSGINEETRWGDLPANGQNRLIEHLLRGSYHVKGKTTFKEEFVTCGGVNLAEIDPQTMQSRIADGIFFAGEIMDVDGITGGYNFQHAWSSAWIAAKCMVPPL